MSSPGIKNLMNLMLLRHVPPFRNHKYQSGRMQHSGKIMRIIWIEETEQKQEIIGRVEWIDGAHIMFREILFEQVKYPFYLYQGGPSARLLFDMMRDKEVHYEWLNDDASLRRELLLRSV